MGRDIGVEDIENIYQGAGYHAVFDVLTITFSKGI
jgi:hypothetical protein